MTYIVYADVLFLRHVIAAGSVFMMVGSVLGLPFRMIRMLCGTILMALFSTGVFLITLNQRTLYYILYAAGFFFMTYFFAVKCADGKSPAVVAAAIVGSCIYFAGMLQLFHAYAGATLTDLRFYIADVLSISGFRLLHRCAEKLQVRECACEVELVFPDFRIRTQAFSDTGNRLFDPFTKKPAIVVDYALLKEYLSEDCCRKLEEYHATGSFSYQNQTYEGAVSFFPLPYHTIENHFSVMPAVKVPQLVFCTDGLTFTGVTAGISRESFFDRRYEVLLPKRLF